MRHLQLNKYIVHLKMGWRTKPYPVPTFCERRASSIEPTHGPGGIAYDVLFYLAYQYFFN